MFATLAPGEYTAVVAGAGGLTGVGLVEAYDLAAAPAPSRMANLSSRGFVGTGDDVLIGGVIVRGTAAAPLVFRAIGPDVGVAGRAGESHARSARRERRDSRRATTTGAATQETEITAAGLAPANDLDAAIIGSFPLGNYTAVVQGANGGTGVALVEAYALE